MASYYRPQISVWGDEMTDEEENLLKKRLRLKWLPYDEGFDTTRADDHYRFLVLPVDEQT